MLQIGCSYDLHFSKHVMVPIFHFFFRYSDIEMNQLFFCFIYCSRLGDEQ